MYFHQVTAVIVLEPLILLLAIPPTAPALSTVIEAPVANPCNAFVTLTVPLPSNTSILSVSNLLT